MVATSVRAAAHYGGAMRHALDTAVRVLRRHWPVLLAWYLGGEAAHLVLLQFAGVVGGSTALGGLLLLPLAVLARLVSYVAMYLVVSPSLPTLAGRHATGAGFVARARVFLGALLSAILPFLTFYTAWGLLWKDQREYYRLAALTASGDLFASGGDPSALAGKVADVGFGWLTVAVFIAALVLRTALSAFAKRLPSGVAVLAVYVETVWVFLLLTFANDLIARVGAWAETRVSAQWLESFGDTVAQRAPMIAEIWEASGGLWGLLFTAILLPLAWVTIVGVIHGDDWRSPFDDASTSRIGRAVRAITRRFSEIADAVRIVWRAGALPVAVLLVAYALWALAERLLQIGVVHLLGPHEAWFWSAFAGIVTVLVAAIMEPLRVAIVSTAYDEFSRDAHRQEVPPAPAGDGSPSGRERDRVRRAPAGADLDAERAGRVVGQPEGGRDAVGGVGAGARRLRLPGVGVRRGAGTDPGSS